jgi:hypothetical protein
MLVFPAMEAKIRGMQSRQAQGIKQDPVSKIISTNGTAASGRP